jgi:hypothetical protein
VPEFLEELVPDFPELTGSLPLAHRSLLPGGRTPGRTTIDRPRGKGVRARAHRHRPDAPVLLPASTRRAGGSLRAGTERVVMRALESLALRVPPRSRLPEIRRPGGPEMKRSEKGRSPPPDAGPRLDGPEEPMQEKRTAPPSDTAVLTEGWIVRPPPTRGVHDLVRIRMDEARTGPAREQDREMSGGRLEGAGHRRRDAGRRPAEPGARTVDPRRVERRSRGQAASRGRPGRRKARTAAHLPGAPDPEAIRQDRGPERRPVRSGFSARSKRPVANRQSAGDRHRPPAPWQPSRLARQIPE